MDKTMSKLIKFILWTVVICIVLTIGMWIFSISVGIGFLSGISKNAKAEKTTTQITAQENNNGENNTNANVNNNLENREKDSSKDHGELYKVTEKGRYYSEFDEIDIQEKEINSKHSDSTYQIIENSKEIYDLWDDELNLIYNNLKKILPNSEYRMLEKKQLEWIDYKENAAKEKYDSYNGSEKADVEKYDLLASLTKERCKYLVDNYVKN